uniref:B-like cyclin n=2 Tax=Rhizophora mucronata TaxID=61149 RepID=A0A2P2J6N4_RHIMU
MEFDLENPLTNSQELVHLDGVSGLFLAESDHMPSENYSETLKATGLDVSFRQEAISSIWQVSRNSDPFFSYLAVNYLDRFLSSQVITHPKPWFISLLAISCVSLAAKMKDTEFSVSNIQGGGIFIFDTQTIHRMEVLVLGALKWRMRSITPFSFISFFISMFALKQPPLRQALRTRATEIMLKAQKDIKLLQFKPSTIAASALLCVSQELFPLQFSSFRNAISNCPYVNKENMFECCDAMQDIAMEGYESALAFETVASLDTPVNVLDRHFSSTESEEASRTITSSRTSLRAEKDTKRRRMNGYCNNQSVQLSHIQHC